MQQQISASRPPVVVINLASDADRLNHMDRQLGELGLNFRRFEAVRGLDAPPALRHLFLDPNGRPLSNLKPGEIGVYASHLSIMQDLIASSDDCVLVMEDDLRISQRLPAFLDSIPLLPDDWDIVRLSNPSKSAYLALNDLGAAGEVISYLRVPNNMGCYLINKSGAEKILSRLSLVKHAIDEDLRRPWDFKLKTYGVSPPPVDANVLPTSSIDAIGARALSSETGFQKLLRRRAIGPIGMLRRVVWQAQTLGPVSWVRCLLRTCLYRIGRRFGLRDRAFLRVRSGTAQ
jgi:glycosyl transferase family 25